MKWNTRCYLTVVVLCIAAFRCMQTKQVEGDDARVSADLEHLTGEAVDERVVKRVKRIIGGEEVEAGDWPWLVSLKGKIPALTVFGIPIIYKSTYCGASLISDRWLLTAAHCFVSDSLGSKALVPKYWHARLGDIDKDRNLYEKMKDKLGDLLDVNSLREWSIHGETIVVHPEYNAAAMWMNDIALVRLREAVPVGAEDIPEIQAVTLAEQGDFEFPSDGQECIMKGWGCSDSIGGAQKDTARQVILPKVNDGSCGRRYGIDTSNRICAGHNLGAMGICSGDSGGPLVALSGDGTWIQVGVASFTSSSRPGDVPGVFTRVSSYTNWIRQTIRDHEWNME